ncbi:rabankyrin-5-like [Ciona intestinalis]
MIKTENTVSWHPSQNSPLELTQHNYITTSSMEVTATEQTRIALTEKERNRKEKQWALSMDADGDTPLHIAIAQENIEAVVTILNVLKRNGISPNMRNYLVQAPVHVAIIIDNPVLVGLLIRTDPTVCTVTDRHGNNGIHLAVKYSSKVTQHATLRMLTRASRTRDVQQRNIYGKLLFILVSIYLYWCSYKQDSGSRLKFNCTGNKRKANPFHSHKIPSFISKGNRYGSDGLRLTPLHLAAQRDDDVAIEILYKAGADINALENRGGVTALILAARQSNVKAARKILEVSYAYAPLQIKTAIKFRFTITRFVTNTDDSLAIITSEQSKIFCA